MEQTVGIRELKTGLSRYLRSVKDGGTVVITEHGKPIGRIIPFSNTLEEKLDLLQQHGLIAWNGERLTPIEPAGDVRDNASVAELLLEDRE